MVKNRLIQHDKSNDGCYITIAEISYQGAVDSIYDELWPCCFPTYQAAMNFFQPQVDGKWFSDIPNKYYANLKHNCNLNHDRPGQARAISVQLKQLLLYKLEDCISMEAEENENKVGKSKRP